MKPIANNLIAPCGMNCTVCRAFLREKNPCCGCRGSDTDKPKTILTCKIRTCDFLKTSGVQFCYACPNFPCKPLKHLDLRYRTRYRTSVIENLESIRQTGVDAFMAKEKEKWRCDFCGGVVCIHDGVCGTCGKVK